MANNEIEALIQSAKAHYQAEEYDEAIADYTKAIDIASDNTTRAKIYLERGNVYKTKGNSDHMAEYDLALADYKQAFILEPNNEEIVRKVAAYSSAVVSSRGNAYLEKKDYTRAIADFKQNIELRTDPFDKAMSEDLLARVYRARDLGADRLLNEEEAHKWQAEHKAASSGSTSSNGNFEFRDSTITKYTGTSTQVVIPDMINGQQVKAIGDFAFYGNELTSVVIPNGITSIGSCAFSNTKLTNVVIPDSVASIEATAFDYGESLRSVTIPGNVDVGSHVFGFYDCYNSHGKKAGVYILLTGKGWRKSGCYVATSVYGSYDCPQVWTLRRYRDFTLAESLFGRAFIRMYYALSPAVVKWFGKKTWFNHLWRSILDRKIANLRKHGINDTPYEDRVW